MKYLLFLTLTLLLAASACEKDPTNPEPDTGTETIFLDDSYFGLCFGGLQVEDTTGVILTNATDYYALGDSCRMLWLSSIKCDTANLPEINFKKYSLIGIMSFGGGCSATSIRSVQIDTATKVYSYSIKHNFFGACEMLLVTMNWALVPAIPDGYRVVFEITEQYE